ncbi:MAG: hypothetical protein RIR26_2570 [Pseudomonadota bacterium]|jgi:ribosomal protein RSM22 (predicted rRNA methylase)
MDRSIALSQEVAWHTSNKRTIFISPSTLIDCWERQLIEICGIKDSFDKRSRTIQSLSDQTKKLWTIFNLNRDALDRDYMSDEKFLSGYLSAFFIPNVERVRHALINSRIENIVSDLCEREVLRILDFGAGPLSATFGTLIAIEMLLAGSVSIKTKRIEITAVERSEKAIQFGIQCIEKSKNKDIDFVTERLTSIPKQKKFDIILAANVLNEVPQKHQATTLNSLIEAMSKETPSLMLALEPGQDSHSRRLSELRDHILTGTSLATKKIIAPCPHERPCPLSPSMNRLDWCWFRSKFPPPIFQLELDAKSKLDHTELAYCYFLISEAGSTTKKKPWAICVSDEMPAGKEEQREKRATYFKKNASGITLLSDEMINELAEHGQKTKLCTAEGSLLGGLRQRTEQSKFSRGDPAAQKDFDLLINER